MIIRFGSRRRIRTRRLALRTRLARCQSTDLGVWRETTQGPQEEHRRHWGGAVRVMRINPMPPCGIAWLVMPSPEAPSSRNL